MAMKNGRDKDYDDPKIASFSDARKKAEAAKRATAKSSGSRRSPGELVFGGLIIAMALGMLVWWGRSLMQSLSFAP